MTGKLKHRSLLIVGLCIAVFLISLLIVDGQPYYNPYPYNDYQVVFDHAGIARAYQNLYNGEYNSYPYNDPQAALDLMDIARDNQMLYNYDSNDWEYWANLWLNAPYY